jgi:hypothetical protein
MLSECADLTCKRFLHPETQGSAGFFVKACEYAVNRVAACGAGMACHFDDLKPQLILELIKCAVQRGILKLTA